MSSRDLFDRARQVMVGGVSSPARAIDPYPPFIASGEGAEIVDVDGDRYVDCCLAFGPKIAGHRHPDVLEAVRAEIEAGTGFGAPARSELRLAEKITDDVPNADKVRLVNSGTEATMLAIRLARGVTGRDGIVKVEGGYHGAHDSLLVKAGSSAAWHGVPDSAGVPEDLARHTSPVPYNDADSIEDALADQDQAAVIVEPVLANAGLIEPDDGYLDAIRRACDETGTLLILDEVVTGYRLGPGGAQDRLGVDADVVTLGKTIGGGYPVGAVAGPADLMANVTPEGKVFNAGTFSGHPVTCAAGLATLEAVEGRLGEAEKLAARLADGLADLAGDRVVHRVASMVCLFFAEGPIEGYDDVQDADEDAFWAFHQAMRGSGVYLPPGQMETWFLSTAHTADQIDAVLEAAKEALA